MSGPPLFTPASARQVGSLLPPHGIALRLGQEGSAAPSFCHFATPTLAQGSAGRHPRFSELLNSSPMLRSVKSSVPGWITRRIISRHNHWEAMVPAVS